MKIFTLIISIVTSTLFYGQDNCSLMIVTNDDVLQKSTISSQEIEFKDFSLTILGAYRIDGEPKMIFKIKEGCIKKNQNIYILFENEKRIATGNIISNKKCDVFSGFYIERNSKKKLLENERIKTIRIDTENSYYQIDLTKEQSELILKIVQCAFDRDSWKEEVKYKW